MSPLRRIGLFGGTFDPPHIGHLVAAVEARHRLHLDEVILMVASTPWQKVDSRTVTPASIRLDMTAAAVRGFHGLRAGSDEVERGGTTYTADTIHELSAADPGTRVVVILGADAFEGLPTWERIDEVIDQAEVAVVTRAGHPTHISEVAARLGIEVAVVDIPGIDVSSSDIRDRVAHGHPIEALVPAGVAEIVAEQGLYQNIHYRRA